MKRHATLLTKQWLWAALLLLSATTSVYSQTVKGRITDDNKEPLIGASVVVEGTTKGTVTNEQGDYSLDITGQSPNMNTLVGTNPLVLPTDAAGNYVVNPLGDLNVNPFLPSTNDNHEVQNRLVGNFYGLFRIPKVAGLTYRVNFGHNLKFFNADDLNFGRF